MFQSLEVWCVFKATLISCLRICPIPPLTICDHFIKWGKGGKIIVRYNFEFQEHVSNVALMCFSKATLCMQKWSGLNGLGKLQTFRLIWLICPNVMSRQINQIIHNLWISGIFFSLIDQPLLVSLQWLFSVICYQINTLVICLDGGNVTLVASVAFEKPPTHIFVLASLTKT